MSEMGNIEKGKRPMLKLVRDGDVTETPAQPKGPDIPPLHQGEKLNAKELLLGLDKYRSNSSDKREDEPDSQRFTELSEK